MSLFLTWGINIGYAWDYAAAGPAGLTVLHLAALLDDGGNMADELTGLQCLAENCLTLLCALCRGKNVLFVSA